MMNKKSLYKLEYNKIIEKLTEHAGSFGGQERCRKLKTKRRKSLEIERMQEENGRSIYTDRKEKDVHLLEAVVR